MEDRFEEDNGIEGICDDCIDRFKENRCRKCKYYTHKTLLIKLNPKYTFQNECVGDKNG